MDAVECINYNCAELPPYDATIASCGSKSVNGGASTLYLLECGASITDPGNQEQINALVAAGDATEITNVKIGFTAPTAITQDSVTSCGTLVTINYTRELNLEDYKVTIANTEFWSTAKKRSFGGAILIECETSGLDRVVTVIDAELTIDSYRDFPNTNEQAQKYVVTGRWKDMDDPLQVLYTPTP